MANITKRSNGSYLIRVFVGYDGDGKQQFKSSTFRPDPSRTDRQNQKALNEFVVDFERAVKSGQFLDGQRLSFREYAEIWLKDYAPQQTAETTLQSYKDTLRIHVYPAIGSIKLSKLQPHHINKMLVDMVSQRKDGKTGGYSNGTISRTHAVISSILSSARREGIVSENVCDRVRKPRNDMQTEKLKAFSLEEANRFISVLESTYTVQHKAHDRIDDTGKQYHVSEYETQLSINPQLRVFFILALTTGCRRGELIALNWSDIDFEENEMFITKSAGKVGSKMIIKTPKNKTSIRTISIPESITAELRSWKKLQNEIRMTLGSKWEGSREEQAVFITDTGSRMYVDTPSTAFRRLIKRYNESVDPAERLPEITLHGLRHTENTLLLNSGAPVKMVSVRSGHSKTSTTMNIYAHSFQSADREAADTLERILHLGN